MKTIKKIGLTKAGDFLGSVLKSAGLKQALESYSFVRDWQTIVGVEVAKYAKPDRIVRGTLYIKVKSPVWAQELSFQKDQILNNIKKHSQANLAVNDLRFFVDPLLK